MPYNTIFGTTPLWIQYVPLKTCMAMSVTSLCVRPASERRRYSVTPSLIDWADTQTDSCFVVHWLVVVISQAASGVVRSISSCLIDVEGLISNFNPHIIMDVITHPCWDWSYSMKVKGATDANEVILKVRLLVCVKSTATTIRIRTIYIPTIMANIANSIDF